MYVKTHYFKRLCLALMVLLGPIAMVQAQQANHWVFGDGVHMEFTGSGISFISGSSLVADEGITSISDPSGNLLFYSDGSTVWDATNTTMPNGTGLLGSNTSTQSAVGVPHPGNSDQYFLFTADQASGGIRYSVIDMTLGSNGDVVSGQKNIAMVSASDATERITAICKGDGNYWIITVTKDNDWLAFDLTSSGVSAVPQVTLASTLGFAASNGYDANVGYLKASPDGSRVCKANRSGSQVFAELVDFNMGTGAFSVGRQITFNRTGYGVEFSPDGNILYVGTFRRVYQYDPSQTTSTALTASENLVFTSPTTSYSERVAALQLGPDGKVYVANGYQSTGGPKMDVIQNPNVWGSGCTYVNNGVTFPSGTRSRMGLPDFPSCFVAPPSDPCDFDVDFSVTSSNCQYTFTDNSTTGSGVTIVGRLWLFGDGQSSTAQNPTHYYQNNGTYNVCLILMGYNGDECCADTLCMEIDVDCDRGDCYAELDLSYSFDADCQYTFTANVGTYSGGQIIGWHWDFGDGNTATGQTVTHSFSAYGVYEVCVTLFLLGPDGCCTVKECIEVEVECAIEPKGPAVQEQCGTDAKGKSPIDLLPENSFELYPNPADNDMNLSLTVSEDSPVLITVSGIEGKETRNLMQMDLKKGRYNFNYSVDDLENGVYIIRCQIGDEVQTSRIVVQH